MSLTKPAAVVAITVPITPSGITSITATGTVQLS